MCDNDYSYVPKFNLGQFCDSPAAAESLANEEVMVGLGRHLVGDWGLVRKGGRDENRDVITRGTGQIISAYSTLFGDDFYIITDLDTKQTVVILEKEASEQCKERVRRRAA